jgi:hypothetical protein
MPLIHVPPVARATARTVVCLFLRAVLSSLVLGLGIASLGSPTWRVTRELDPVVSYGLWRACNGRDPCDPLPSSGLFRDIHDEWLVLVTPHDMLRTRVLMSLTAGVALLRCICVSGAFVTITHDPTNLPSVRSWMRMAVGLGVVLTAVCMPGILIFMYETSSLADEWRWKYGPAMICAAIALASNLIEQFVCCNRR